MSNPRMPKLLKYEMEMNDLTSLEFFAERRTTALKIARNIGADSMTEINKSGDVTWEWNK